MKIEDYTIQFNTSATQYRGQLIEAVPFWRLYDVDKSDKHNVKRIPIGTFSMHELQLYFRSMYDNNVKRLPGHSFEAYARSSRRLCPRYSKKSTEQMLKLLKKKIKQLERKLNQFEQ